MSWLFQKAYFFQWESECLGYVSPLQGHREGVMLDAGQNHRVLAAYPILSLHQADNCPTVSHILLSHEIGKWPVLWGGVLSHTGYRNLDSDSQITLCWEFKVETAALRFFHLSKVNKTSHCGHRVGQQQANNGCTGHTLTSWKLYFDEKGKKKWQI